MNKKSGLTAQSFNIFTKFWDSITDLIFYLPCGGERHFRQKCIDFAGLARGDCVLDVCCGTGMLTSLIAGQVRPDGYVVGVDNCEPVLDEARKNIENLPAKFLQSEAKNLPFDSASFNKCFISFGLHHILRRDRHSTLKELRRVLMRGGSLYIVEYNLPDTVLARLMGIVFTKLDKSEEAYNMVMSDSLLGEIQQAGLEIRKRELTCRGIVQLVQAGYC